MYIQVLLVYIVLAIASCVTFFCIQGSASNFPTACIRLGALKVRTVYDPRLQPAQVDTVLDAIYDTNKFLDGRFILPRRIALKIEYYGPNASRSGRQIIVPYVYDFTPGVKKIAKNPDFRLPWKMLCILGV